MPRGIYSRDDTYRIGWTVAQDEWLKARCSTNQSYTVIASDFCRAFPSSPKSRNAIMGRAMRKGWAQSKPSAGIHYGGKKKGHQERVKRMSKAKKNQPMKLAPVVFKNSDVEFRPEGKIRADRMKKPRTAAEIAEAKKGHLPEVIEERPSTSVLFTDCPDDGCRWPTCDDPFKVCGAPKRIGSYCARHGNVAYRELPTVGRNRIALRITSRAMHVEDLTTVKVDDEPTLVPMMLEGSHD